MSQTVYIAGHNGMVGSAIIRQLKHDSTNIIVTASRGELDLTNQQAVNQFFTENNIDQVYLAAAKVGGIHANNEYPAEFIYQNLMIEANIIHAAHKNNVQKLLFLGSSCIYPKLAQQPMTEDALMTGVLESTNEPYAISKIAGIKLCESYNRQFGRDYRSVMPTNLYGENDNFHPENSHVIPALIRRFHEAKLNNDKQVIAWGSGKPMREFLHVDEMAQASIFVMNLDDNIYQQETSPMLSHINVGTGVDCTIRELVETVVKVIGYQGEIVFDTTKPDGAARKLMDVSRLVRLGWKAKMNLDDGLKMTYQWFVDNQNNCRDV
ncbi:MAG: GDP-L-fucose synthase [Enterobacterales bacterium]|jgi:GDP-L-fucose synthase